MNGKYRITLWCAGAHIRYIILSFFCFLTFQAPAQQLDSVYHVYHVCFNSGKSIGLPDSSFSLLSDYQWEIKKQANGDWIHLQNEKKDTLKLDSIRDTTYVRYICNKGYSTSNDTLYYAIIPYPNILSGTISGADTICYADTLYTLRFTVWPSGGGDRYLYQWESSYDSVTFAPLSGKTAPYYMGDTLQSDRYYRVVVTSELGCSSATTDVVTVRVLPQFLPGSIVGADTVCYGTAPHQLSMSGDASGGMSPYKYQWQQSQDGSAYFDMPGDTGTTFQPGDLRKNMFYRLSYISGNGCGIAYSAPVEIYVYDSLEPAVLGPSTLPTICHGTRPDTLQVSVQAKGGDEVYTTEWQRYDGTAWKPIVGAVALEYCPPALMDTTLFRVASTSGHGCGTVYSVPLVVNVYDKIKSGYVPSQTICHGTRPDTLLFTVKPSGGGDSYRYQWQSSYDSLNFSLLSENTVPHFIFDTLDTLHSKRYYRVVVVSELGCSSDTTGVVTVRVLSPFLPGSIVGADTVCYGTAPHQLSMSGDASGGMSPYKYQWQQSQDGSAYFDMPGDTGTTFQPGDLRKNMFYRLSYISGNGCGIVYSSPVEIYVYDSLEPAVLGPSSLQTICYGTRPDMLLFKVKPSGGGDRYRYQWQSSYDSLNFSTLSRDTAPYYVGDTLHSNRYYRVVVVSELGCSSDTTGVVTVRVKEQLISGKIADNQEVCYSFDASKLEQLTPTTGGYGDYLYQWMQSPDTVNWIKIDSATDRFYYPLHMETTTYYRLVTVDKCGSISSNTIKVLVNPLPHIQTIQGKDSVCFNQYAIYYIDTVLEGFSYNWSLDPSQGQIVSTSSSDSSVEILWKNNINGFGVQLLIRNIKTSCERKMEKHVTIFSRGAPDRTRIIKKPGATNILIAETENDDYYYEWGFTDTNGKETVIPGQHQRYVLLPHYNTKLYKYWLKLYSFRGSDCYSYNAFEEATGLTDMMYEKNDVFIVNATSSGISMRVVNPENNLVECRVYSALGQLLYQQSLGYGNDFVHQANVACGAGVYLVRVQIGKEAITKKCIVR